MGAVSTAESMTDGDGWPSRRGSSPQIAFFRFIAKAVINAAAGGLPVGDFIVDVLPEIGRDVWDAWAGPRTEAERRAEVEAVVLIPDSEAPFLAAEVVAEVAADQPEAVRQLVTGYLTMVPAAARASLRRQSDPSGTTVPPDLVPRSADELIRLLPSRLPRFKPGDRPPGLDWELERLLGVGGFGEVWKARHLYQRSRPPVALKFCLDPAAARLLRNEVGCSTASWARACTRASSACWTRTWAPSRPAWSTSTSRGATWPA